MPVERTGRMVIGLERCDARRRKATGGTGTQARLTLGHSATVPDPRAPPVSQVVRWLLPGTSMNEAAIPRGQHRAASANPTTERRRPPRGQADGIEPAYGVVQGDFVPIVAPPRLQDRESKGRTGINQIPESGVPAPGSGRAVCWQLGHKALVGSVIATQPGSEDLRVAVPCEPWMEGEQEPASQREQEDGAEGPEPRARAGAERALEAGGSQGEPKEDIRRPDDQGRMAPATEDRPEADDDEGTQDQPDGDELSHRPE